MKKSKFNALFNLAALLMLLACSPSAQNVNSDSKNQPDKSEQSFRSQMLSSIKTGNTIEAINLLSNQQIENASLLKKQLEMVQGQFSRGLIEFDEFARTLARINYSILELTPKETSAFQAIPSDQIRKLLAVGKLEEGLELLSTSNPDDAALQLSRINIAQKYYKLGTLDTEGFNRIKAHINYAVLEICNNR